MTAAAAAEMRQHVESLTAEQRRDLAVDLLDLIEDAGDLAAFATALGAQGRPVMRLVYEQRKEIRGAPSPGTAPAQTLRQLGIRLEIPAETAEHWRGRERLEDVLAEAHITTARLDDPTRRQLRRRTRQLDVTAIAVVLSPTLYRVIHVRVR
jgi:hypothetical protein